MLSMLSVFIVCTNLGWDDPADSSVRFASFNCSLAAKSRGELVDRFSKNTDSQAIAIAQIIRTVRPDVLLLNEFDFDVEGRAVKLFCENYLQRDHSSDVEHATSPIEYPFVVSLPSNTGVPTGCDMDNDGIVAIESGTPEFARDAKGYGTFEGQYGMILLSRYPIDRDAIRTFRNFLWKDMPNANLPRHPETHAGWYTDQELAVLPLSSKSHWDVPVVVGARSIHVLVSHPTPPVFDGPEDRNGCRNFDEIRFFVDYVQPAKSAYIQDDAGKRGGLPAGSDFVVLGDLNSDPVDGDGRRAVSQWFDSGLIISRDPPRSNGGKEASLQGSANQGQAGDPSLDTSSFDADRGPGNLRLDYALVSENLSTKSSGVYWPGLKSPALEQEWVRASDHRMVWVDLVLSSNQP